MKFLDDSYLRGLLFHDSWASNVRNVRRSYPPRHFPRPCFFFNPHPSLSSSLSSSQPTVFSRYPQFTTRIADSCRLASRSGINPRVSIPYRATKYANSMPVPSLLFIFLAFTRQLFRASSLELHGFMTSV